MKVSTVFLTVLTVKFCCMENKVTCAKKYCGKPPLNPSRQLKANDVMEILPVVQFCG